MIRQLDYNGNNWCWLQFMSLITDNLVFQIVWPIMILLIVVSYSVVLFKETQNSLNAFKLHSIIAILFVSLTFLVSLGCFSINYNFWPICLIAFLNVFAVALSLHSLSIKNGKLFYFNKNIKLDRAKVKAVTGTIHIFNGFLLFLSIYLITNFFGMEVINNKIYETIIQCFISMIVTFVTSEIMIGLINYGACISYDNKKYSQIRDPVV